jgi:DNA-binding MarR family transcriptional regulator
MPRQVDGKIYFNTEEVKDTTGWSRDSLYRFYRRGMINPKKFLGDRKTYWEAEALEQLSSTVIDSKEGFHSNRPGAYTSTSSEVKAGDGHSPTAQGRRLRPTNSNSQKIEDVFNLKEALADNSESSAGKAKIPEKREENATGPGFKAGFESLGIDISEQEDFTDKLMAYWKRELPGLDEELFGLFGRLQRAGRIFDKDVERSMKQNGLKVSEFLVLGALRRIGPPYCLTPTELFKSLLITSGTITKRIDRLEERALVERRPDPSDRRGTLVCLTSTGKEIVDNAVASPGEEQYRWLVDVLTPVERKVLINLLRKLLLNREKLSE